MQGQLGQPGPGQRAGLVAIRYAGAILCVAAGVALARVLPPIFDPTVLLLMAVVVAAWFSGLWPALLASVVATLAFDYYFTPPLYTLTPDLVHLPRLAVFIVFATLFATASAARRRAEQSLREARDELEMRVRERTADLTRANEALEDLAGRLINAQEQERSRIGRELHDHISQTLGVLTIKIDQLRAEHGIPTALAGSLDELRQDSVDVADDVHRLSHRLHSSTLDYLGLVPALEKLTNEFSARHGIAIEFAHHTVPRTLPSDVSLCLFRVTEESLTNIAKHSQAESAHVMLRGEPDALHLTIQDTGVGFDPGDLDTRAGLGFVSMRERLRVLHGTLQVDSARRRGTRIDVTIPADLIDAERSEREPSERPERPERSERSERSERTKA
jgi:signal transduction histidine kinase